MAPAVPLGLPKLTASADVAHPVPDGFVVVDVDATVVEVVVEFGLVVVVEVDAFVVVVDDDEELPQAASPRAATRSPTPVTASGPSGADDALPARIQIVRRVPYHCSFVRSARCLHTVPGPGRSPGPATPVRIAGVRKVPSATHERTTPRWRMQ